MIVGTAVLGLGDGIADVAAVGDRDGMMVGKGEMVGDCDVVGRADGSIDDEGRFVGFLDGESLGENDEVGIIVG